MKIVTITMNLAFMDSQIDDDSPAFVEDRLQAYAIDRLDASAVGITASVRTVDGVNDVDIDTDIGTESEPTAGDKWVDRANKEVGNG